MNPAPVFRPAMDPVSSAYHAWAEHYNTCSTCQREDWMNPTLGERDLCEKGRSLFRNWVVAAGMSPQQKELTRGLR